MEVTKKEYITRLKKELDTIEKRYQHLLNENAMIGEDFRSRARGNLVYAQGLEQRIEDLEAEIKGLKGKMDDKDMEFVQQGRELETFQMLSEEYLTHYDLMRADRDRLQEISDTQTNLANERATKIETILQDHEEKERNRLEGREEVGTQTIIGQNYFNKKPGQSGNDASSRASGSVQGSSQRERGPGLGAKKVGGGGQIARRPPPGGPNRKVSNADGQSVASKGLAVDTASSHSRQKASQDGDS